MAKFDTTGARLIYSTRGETSGHQSVPIQPMTMVAGRPMLGGLKLLLDRFRLFSDSDDLCLLALLKRSRDAQASVSTALAEQVLGALRELLRGLDGSEPALERELATSRPDHLYEGLLTVLMRLVVVLCAEDAFMSAKCGGSLIADQPVRVRNAGSSVGCSQRPAPLSSLRTKVGRCPFRTSSATGISSSFRS